MYSAIFYMQLNIHHPLLTKKDVLYLLLKSFNRDTVDKSCRYKLQSLIESGKNGFWERLVLANGN